MSKYARLSEHLAALTENEWTASFEDIEAILGFKLPQSSRLYPAWWANETSGGHSQKVGWHSAGWRTGNLDLKRGMVSFYRESLGSIPKLPVLDASKIDRVRPLTIADAKAGLAELYGVALDQIEITIKG